MQRRNDFEFLPRPEDTPGSRHRILAAVNTGQPHAVYVEWTLGGTPHEDLIIDTSCAPHGDLLGCIVGASRVFTLESLPRLIRQWAAKRVAPPDSVHTVTELWAPPPGYLLRRARTRLGINQAAASKLANISPKHYSRLERGERRIRAHHLRALLLVLPLTQTELWLLYRAVALAE